MQLTPSVIAGRYRVQRELGRGGMGVVYVVEHAHTGDQLALKVLLAQGAAVPTVVERFKREARASAQIRSEHVVRVVDADVAPELNGAPFLVMELLDGADLQKQVETEGRLAPENVIDILKQVARALDKAHALGIVHRDLKPENLFLHRREDGSRIVKILDFGISKFTGGDGANPMAAAGLTATGEVMGTPYYMSPEQARGQVDQISPRTDIWALGLIGLQLLTGEIYWVANTVAELMVAILMNPFEPPSARWPWLPRAVDAWFLRSCARDPRERFATVSEQVAALEAAFTNLSTTAAVSPSSPSLPHAPPSSPWGPPQAGNTGPPQRASSPGFAPVPVLARTTTAGTARDMSASSGGVPAITNTSPPAARTKTMLALFGALAFVGIAASGAAFATRRYHTDHAPPAAASEAGIPTPAVETPIATPTHTAEPAVASAAPSASSAPSARVPAHAHAPAITKPVVSAAPRASVAEPHPGPPAPAPASAPAQAPTRFNPTSL